MGERSGNVPRGENYPIRGGTGGIFFQFTSSISACLGFFGSAHLPPHPLSNPPAPSLTISPSTFETHLNLHLSIPIYPDPATFPRVPLFSTSTAQINVIQSNPNERDSIGMLHSSPTGRTHRPRSESPGPVWPDTLGSHDDPSLIQPPPRN
ncbi:hypothetical protein ASPBRDRAFT_344639 [Aspergillus brasiliensis CBS 101740]|uniref:Uncharacterized protein n=1 Tax=Aspergillus brasiliensis (strain CBS 101740 / IMI 381727 / IBT 21946) TaxID=767769 RepID=A0A1L9U710_ASPBC|nr:hypothetical protein ASPBRDRAFT_344639 [Aspergillus brasiliensis CBS 101740]